MRAAPLVIAITCRSDVAVAVARARRFAAARGQTRPMALRLGLIVAELATNILKFGVEGRIELHWSGVEIVVDAFDAGPGLEDRDLCRRDGYSRGHFVGADERSLGVGLGTIERLGDRLEIGPEIGPDLHRSAERPKLRARLRVADGPPQGATRW